MKRLIAVAVFILVFLMPLSYAKTETVILNKGKSYVIEDVNVTLIDYNKKKEKLLVCVDGKRAILSDDKRIGQVYFEIRTFRNDGVKVELEADCDDCIAGDNSECFPAKNFTEEENDFEIEDEIENITEDNETIETEENIKEVIKSNYDGILKKIVTSILNLFS